MKLFYNILFWIKYDIFGNFVILNSYKHCICTKNKALA